MPKIKVILGLPGCNNYDKLYREIAKNIISFITKNGGLFNAPAVNSMDVQTERKQVVDNVT